MNSTKIIKKVDDVGRVVLPFELRKVLNINTGDSLEVYVSNESIIFKKYAPACIFCNNTDEVSNFKGKNICKNCLEQLIKTI